MLMMTPFAAGVVMATAAFLMLVAIGCGDGTSGDDESLSLSEIVTPTLPDTPDLNIQFFGAADLSDESKASLADLIADIQAGVVQITTDSGSGSGFIINADGLVMTNEPVVGGAQSVTIWLTNGRRYNGDVLERDATADLALVQIDSAERFDPIAIGDPDGVRVGDEVLALGFPLAGTIGNSLTVTRGIISSVRKTAGVDLWQTDAAINPGNSGGPLVGSDGRVIGVNTSRIEETDSGKPVQNIGFAVSVIEFERRLGALSGRGITERGTPPPTPTPAPTPTPFLNLVPADFRAPQQHTTLSSGGHHTCALRADGSTVCWGKDEYGQASPPEGERFVSASSGGDHTCALRADGSAVCWGKDEYGQASPPEGERFVSISNGWEFTCALRLDGSLVCWGDNGGGRASPPQNERFISISSGGGHTCALRPDGSAVCWGGDRRGQASPPEGERFVSISSGGGHTCALRPEGSAVCWGEDGNGGQASPPRRASGLCPSAAVGDTHAHCGLRAAPSAGEGVRALMAKLHRRRASDSRPSAVGICTHARCELTAAPSAGARTPISLIMAKRHRRRASISPSGGWGRRPYQPPRRLLLRRQLLHLSPLNTPRALGMPMRRT